MTGPLLRRSKRPAFHGRLVRLGGGHVDDFLYSLGSRHSRFPGGAFAGRRKEFAHALRTGRERPKDLAALRPDLPAWLGAILGRAIAVDPGERFRDAMEFAAEMEAGPPRAPPAVRRPQTLLERAPVRFWQGVAALLALALLASLFWRR